ncbi:hypothetical protein ADUPG1_007102, partial [Aduncisulcus paluster]
AGITTDPLSGMRVPVCVGQPAVISRPKTVIPTSGRKKRRRELPSQNGGQIIDVGRTICVFEEIDEALPSGDEIQLHGMEATDPESGKKKKDKKGGPPVPEAPPILLGPYVSPISSLSLNSAGEVVGVCGVSVWGDEEDIERKRRLREKRKEERQTRLRRLEEEKKRRQLSGEADVDDREMSDPIDDDDEDIEDITVVPHFFGVNSVDLFSVIRSRRPGSSREGPSSRPTTGHHRDSLSSTNGEQDSSRAVVSCGAFEGLKHLSGEEISVSAVMYPNTSNESDELSPYAQADSMVSSPASSGGTVTAWDGLVSLCVHNIGSLLSIVIDRCTKQATKTLKHLSALKKGVKDDSKMAEDKDDEFMRVESELKVRVAEYDNLLLQASNKFVLAGEGMIKEWESHLTRTRNQLRRILRSTQDESVLMSVSPYFSLGIAGMSFDEQEEEEVRRFLRDEEGQRIGFNSKFKSHLHDGNEELNDITNSIDELLKQTLQDGGEEDPLKRIQTQSDNTTAIKNLMDKLPGIRASLDAANSLVLREKARREDVLAYTQSGGKDGSSSTARLSACGETLCAFDRDKMDEAERDIIRKGKDVDRLEAMMKQIMDRMRERQRALELHNQRVHEEELLRKQRMEEQAKKDKERGEQSEVSEKEKEHKPQASSEIPPFVDATNADISRLLGELTKLKQARALSTQYTPDLVDEDVQRVRHRVGAVGTDLNEFMQLDEDDEEEESTSEMEKREMDKKAGGTAALGDTQRKA